jgi:hypothetical protein
MGFALRSEDIDLPLGAIAAGGRTLVTFKGQTVFGLTQGAHRAYLFPLFSPAGFALTSESPADHPHHHSLWVGADHVNLHVPAQYGTEVYSYNFYVNDVFQGRAPGRIAQTQLEAQEDGDGLLITQQLQWLGPREWGAPQGRHVLDETRLIRVRHLADSSAFQLTLRSELSAVSHPVSIGPTRHAWFNARIGPGMAPIHGGQIRSAPASTPQSAPSWQMSMGAVGGGHVAGVALSACMGAGNPDWYVSPWGVMTANPCLHQALRVEPGGQPLSLSCRALAFDGSLDDAQITQGLTAPPSGA